MIIFVSKTYIVNRFYSVLFIFVFLFSYEKDPMFNKYGRPSTYGITTYIDNNHDSIIKDYETRISDTLYDVFITVDNLSYSEGNSEELGVFYIPDNIIVTNEEKYVAYKFSDLSRFRQNTSIYSERTLTAVLYHELTHAYFNQILYIMKSQNKSIASEYGIIRMFPNAASRFGSEFIEEGICEYVVYHLKESAPLRNIVEPKTENDLLGENNKINSIYRYSVVYLEDFLDKYGLKQGIEILIGNKPPSYREILEPELFFNRLNYN